MGAALTGLDLERPPRVGPLRAVVALVGLLLAGFAWVQVLDRGELTITDIEVATPRGVMPVTVIAPAELAGAAAPGVVVAHGFAGSAILMRSTAVALAERGMVVAVPDLSGHGANRNPLPQDDDGVGLRGDVLAAVDLLEGRDDVAPASIGVVGHSMGSGAVLQAGIADPQRIAAVVAISPTDAPVTEEVPRNLLLLAGSLETPFATNAQRLVERAGGPSDDLPAALAAGEARDVELIDGVEHVTILFSARAHDAAADWLLAALDTTDGPAGGDDVDAGASPVQDAAGAAPIWWWVVHLVGVVAAWLAITPWFVERVVIEGRRGRPVVGLLAGTVLGTLLFAILGAVVDLSVLAGMLVGPALVGWFALGGIVWTAVGHRPGPPGGRDLVWGLVLLAVLVVAFGALAPQVWLPTVPAGTRAVLILPFTLALLPWTTAWAAAVHDRRVPAAIGWWLLVSIVVVTGANTAAGVVDGLGFVRLIAPVLPLVLGLVHLVTAPLRRPWAASIALAGFLAWLIAILFPLV